LNEVLAIGKAWMNKQLEVWKGFTTEIKDQGQCESKTTLFLKVKRCCSWIERVGNIITLYVQY
jgi:hypothetical protein